MFTQKKKKKINNFIFLFSLRFKHYPGNATTLAVTSCGKRSAALKLPPEENNVAPSHRHRYAPKEILEREDPEFTKQLIRPQGNPAIPLANHTSLFGFLN